MKCDTNTCVPPKTTFSISLLLQSHNKDKMLMNYNSQHEFVFNDDY